MRQVATSRPRSFRCCLNARAEGDTLREHDCLSQPLAAVASPTRDRQLSVKLCIRLSVQLPARVSAACAATTRADSPRRTSYASRACSLTATPHGSTKATGLRRKLRAGRCANAPNMPPRTTPASTARASVPIAAAASGETWTCAQRVPSTTAASASAATARAPALVERLPTCRCALASGAEAVGCSRSVTQRSPLLMLTAHIRRPRLARNDWHLARSY